jgi:hypothetical protein
MPVPARFKLLEKAKLYCRELNLRKGPYHPGYFVEEQDDNRTLLPTLGRAARSPPWDGV